MKRTSTLLSACTILLGSALMLQATPGAAPRAETARRVFFSAVDQKGAAVTDLTSEEMTVKEGGKDQRVATLRPATGNFQVSILVDDGGQGSFQAGVSHFISRTFGHAEYAISMLNPQPLKLVDYTGDGSALQVAVGKLIQRGRLQQDGLQMIEAVSWAAKELMGRKAPRPVILALTNGGEPGSSEVADFILRDLKDSGASLHVVYVNGLQLGKVLNEGPKYSGGILQNAVSNATVNDALTRIASALLNQYELTYTLPDGTKANDRLQLQTTRKGVTLIAPQRIPER